MTFMERRMETMLAAFEAFYATMTKKQKARLDSVGPHRWGWHWRWNG
jgi:hypothetical protein